MHEVVGKVFVGIEHIWVPLISPLIQLYRELLNLGPMLENQSSIVLCDPYF